MISTSYILSMCVLIGISQCIIVFCYLKVSKFYKSHDQKIDFCAIKINELELQNKKLQNQLNNLNLSLDNILDMKDFIKNEDKIEVMASKINSFPEGHYVIKGIVSKD